jgi:hypothetical protein
VKASYEDYRRAAKKRSEGYDAQRQREALAASRSAEASLRRAERHVDTAERAQRELDGCEHGEEQRIRVEHQVVEVRRAKDRAKGAAQGAAQAARRPDVRSAQRYAAQAARDEQDAGEAARAATREGRAKR